MIQVSDAWKAAFPGASVGVLLVNNVSNPAGDLELDRQKQQLEEALRRQFSSREEIASSPVIQAYDRYFRRFDKTYPVELQVESVAVKKKGIPRVAALVEAMFMAELKNMLLTAGHDYEAIRPPVRLDVSTGNERYTRMNGKEQALKPGDMMMADSEGVISCVVYGPDQRTQITPATKRALFVVYAPPGVGPDQVTAHLQNIFSNVTVVSGKASVEARQVVTAD